MVDIASMVSIIVGIVLSFSGVVFAMLGAAQKKALERIQSTVDDHSIRLTYLEKRDAVRESEIKQIIKELTELSKLLRRHMGTDGSE